MLGILGGEGKQENKNEVQEMENYGAEAGSAVKLLEELLNLGYRKNASDIHLEPQEDRMVVRMRLDGMLLHVREYDKEMHQPLVTRAKVLSGMDIAKKRVPQDGHFKEMIDGISLELVEKRLVTDQLVLTVGYDIENLTRPEIRKVYKGPVTTDRYGRRVPKHAHGTWNLSRATSSSSELLEAMAALYDKIVNPALLIRRMSLSACHVVNEKMAKEREQKETFEQLDLFTDYAKKEAKEKEEQKKRERERRMQEALLTIKKKYGKNAVLRGMNFEEGATAKERNGQIGGHQA